jgi:hypothetical protein
MIQGPNGPKNLKLSQNYPNPFNPTTNFEFQIADFGSVTLKVFDTLGREIAVLVNGNRPPGRYQVQWNGTGFPSGIYYYQLTADRASQVKAMALVK